MTQPSLGMRIAELRNKKGITQKELADACNVDIRTIQRIESGHVVPRMYTIRLLATALDTDISIFSDSYDADPLPEKAAISQQLKWPLMAGIVFSVNYIPVSFQVIKQPFDIYIETVLITIHIIACIFFLRGFYLLGKQFNNQVMAIPALLSMVLLPLLNLVALLEKVGSFNSINLATLFTASCINAVIFGIGLLIEAKKRKLHNNLYKIAGYTTLVQSGLFLTADFKIVSAGLIISIFCNFVMMVILFKESREIQQHTGEDASHAALV
jgi:transcriptional regulator with XRE-family HTH domain